MAWANDDLANATVLTGASGSITPLTIEPTNPASSEAGENVYGVGETLWWKWTATNDGEVSFSVTGSPNSINDEYGLDTKMQVFSGPADSPTHAALSRVGQNDDNDAGEVYLYNSRVTLIASAGVTYYVQVDMYNNDSTGTLHLSWGAYVPPPPPPEDLEVAAVRTWGTSQFIQDGYLPWGRYAAVIGTGLDQITAVQLPDGTYASDLTLLDTNHTLRFTFPDGMLGGALRVFKGAVVVFTQVVVPLRPDSSWQPAAAPVFLGRLLRPYFNTTPSKQAETVLAALYRSGTTKAEMEATAWLPDTTPVSQYRTPPTYWQEAVAIALTDITADADDDYGFRPYLDLVVTPSVPGSAEYGKWAWEVENPDPAAPFTRRTVTPLADSLVGQVGFDNFRVAHGGSYAGADSSWTTRGWEVHALAGADFAPVAAGRPPLDATQAPDRTALAAATALASGTVTGNGSSDPSTTLSTIWLDQDRLYVNPSNGHIYMMLMMVETAWLNDQAAPSDGLMGLSSNELDKISGQQVFLTHTQPRYRYWTPYVVADEVETPPTYPTSAGGRPKVAFSRNKPLEPVDFR